MKPLDRFLRLERPRKDCEHEATPAARFSSLEVASSEASNAVVRQATGLERFAPEREAPLELEAPDAAQPFVRCLHCGADSPRHATVCGQCEARLDSDDVHAFNAELWKKATAERAVEREQEALRLRELEGRSNAVSELGSRQLGESLASEVAAQEEVRFSLARPFFWPGMNWGRLSRGPTARAPNAVILVAVGSAVLVSLFRHGRVGLWVPLLAAVVAVLLVIATRRR